MGINKCGYRVLKAKRDSQLVFIFGSDKLPDNVIGLTPVLSDNLQLKKVE
jgi:hypothetical protein